MFELNTTGDNEINELLEYEVYGVLVDGKTDKKIVRSIDIKSIALNPFNYGFVKIHYARKVK